MIKAARVMLAAAAILTATADHGRAEFISLSLRSGDGIERPPFFGPAVSDPRVTMFVGPQNGPWGFPLHAPGSFFNAADNGPPAFVVRNNDAWKPTLDGDPLADWITTDPNGSAGDGATALYAVDFFIDPSSAGAAISEALLDFSFMTDNDLGDGINEGLFVNGTAVAGTRRLGGNPAFYKQEQSFGTLDVTPLVTTGKNTLFINAVDRGGPSGLIFSANLQVTTLDPPTDTPPPVSAVPEPSSLALLGTGALGLIGYARRRRGGWGRNGVPGAQPPAGRSGPCGSS